MVLTAQIEKRCLTIFTLANGTLSIPVHRRRLPGAPMPNWPTRWVESMEFLIIFWRNSKSVRIKRYFIDGTMKWSRSSSYASDGQRLSVLAASHIRKRCCSRSNLAKWVLAAPLHVTQAYSITDLTCALQAAIMVLRSNLTWQRRCASCILLNKSPSTLVCFSHCRANMGGIPGQIDQKCLKLTPSCF